MNVYNSVIYNYKYWRVFKYLLINAQTMEHYSVMKMGEVLTLSLTTI